MENELVMSCFKYRPTWSDSLVFDHIFSKDLASAKEYITDELGCSEDDLIIIEEKSQDLFENIPHEMVKFMTAEDKDHLLHMLGLNCYFTHKSKLIPYRNYWCACNSPDERLTHLLELNLIFQVKRGEYYYYHANKLGLEVAKSLIPIMMKEIILKDRGLQDWLNKTEERLK